MLNKEANEQLHKALKFIKSENKIVPVSGYRSLNEQTELFNSSIKENGEEFTYRYVALPNASEHQTGLAIDLGLNLPEIDFIRPSFPHEGITEEFRHIASDFGFIERYQKIKQNITLIDAEEWHFRYVTYPHSKIITERGLCLEEYIELLKHESLKYEDYEITYIKYQEGLEIDSENIISISGNNQDGFIITKKIN